MATPESHSVFDKALAHHQAGRLLEAVALYRQIITRGPADARAHCNLGTALQALGQVDEAVASLRQAIALNPKLPAAHANLGVALRAKGQLDESIVAYRAAIALQPQYADAHFNLANALSALGKIDEAIAAYRQAIVAKPNYAEAHSNLGIALEEAGAHGEAIAVYRQAIALNPNYAQAHNNLGAALQNAGERDEAILSYRRAITLKPNYPQAYYNLGNAHRSSGQPDEAIAAYRQAISLKPNYPEAFNNLGNALKDIGQLDQAIAAYRQAMALAPEVPEYHSNLILSTYYQPTISEQVIAEELERWNLKFAQPRRKFIRSHSNDRTPDRRLRIGYLSPDFSEHVVGQHLLPLIQNHDRKQFEIFCYSQVRRDDALTHRFQQHADRWRKIVGVADEQVNEQIRADQIDILVDLSLHSANNRLPVYAFKPAPLQVSYLGYCGSAGISAMDYRISDPYLDPPNSEISPSTEKTVRLPKNYWCYQPWHGTTEPTEVPALKNSYITFGCLNNFTKVSPPALALWASILAAVPNSRLILHAPPGECRTAVANRFSRSGVESARLTFVGKQSWTQYTQTYSQIDVALDPFPYGGGITTCDALWMGVPVVSLSGETAVGRGGRSILSNLNLSELVAYTSDEYAQITIDLAADVGRRVRLRRDLRDRMLASPLLHARQFTMNFEAIMRKIWIDWCHMGNARVSEANRSPDSANR